MGRVLITSLRPYFCPLKTPNQIRSLWKAVRYRDHMPLKYNSIEAILMPLFYFAVEGLGSFTGEDSLIVINDRI